MDYGKIFTRSWEVFWKHKILWVFGLLNGVMGVFTGIYSFVNYRFSYQNLVDFQQGALPFSQNTMEILRWAVDNPALFTAGIIVAVLLFMFLSLLLCAFSSSGIIQGNLFAAAGEEDLAFDQLAKAIRPFFWRVVGLSALLGVGAMGLMMGLMLILLVLAVFTLGIGMLCFFPLICLLAPVMGFLGVVVFQATVAIIAEDENIIEALKRGWQLVTKKIGPYFLVWLLSMVITFAVQIILSIPSYISMAPVYASMFSFESLQDPAVMYQAMEGPMMWVGIWGAIQSLLMGVVNVYVSSIWVQTYLEAREDGTLETPDSPQLDGPEPESLEQTS